MQITFGDNCDCDTYIAMFDHMDGFCLGINGQDYEVMGVSDSGFHVRKWDEEAGCGAGEERVIAWEDAETVSIY